MIKRPLIEIAPLTASAEKKRTMAKTELQQLTSHIRTIQNWTNEQSVLALQDVFISLNELDQQINNEKWDELKKALAENKELRDTDVQQFLSRKALAKKGYWYWNPENWEK